MSCERFESEALLAIERGEALDAHFETCPDCVAAKGRHERLRVALTTVDEGIFAPRGFEAGVWARIDRRAPASRKPLVAGFAAALAVGIAAIAFWPREPAAPGLAVEIGRAPTRTRGEEAARGDVLHLRATTGPSAYAELRVYWDGSLAFRCSSEPRCRRKGDRLEAEAPVTGPGRHELFLFLADAPLPPPAGRLDADMDAAVKAGAQVFTVAPIQVN